MKIKTLSGLVLIRNGLALEYCFQEAIRSLLPVCDEVVVCDGQSVDGTQELIREWAAREPKIKLCVYQWPDPVGKPDFYVDWIQYGRQHVSSDLVIHLDADEILSERSYPIVSQIKERPGKFSVWCHRYNFWKDPYHLIPHGVCCSHEVVRICPQSSWLPSDGPHPLGAPVIRMAIFTSPMPEIMHYGFLRSHDAYFEKSRQLHTMFFGGMTDQRMLDVEKKPGNWMAEIAGVEWTDRLVPFTGNHPKLAEPWLRAHGWKI